MLSMPFYRQGNGSLGNDPDDVAQQRSWILNPNSLAPIYRLSLYQLPYMASEEEAQHLLGPRGRFSEVQLSGLCGQWIT